MFIVKHRYVFFAISGALVLASLVSLFVYGLNPGVDFKGGSLIEVEYVSRPDKVTVETALKNLSFGDVSIRETGDAGYIIRAKELTPDEQNALIGALGHSPTGETLGKDVSVKRFDSVGPVLGQEAVKKAWWSIALVLAAIVIFVTFAFRKVSEPVSSWKYGLVTIVALAHDVLIPTGVFAVLGRFAGFEIDTLFVTALLVILGFSVHDTIVVFDRIRENLKNKLSDDFSEVVGKSVEQTFVRSINTSLTTLIAVAALYVLGPEATQHFALALFIGIVAGAYSSIFLASPLLIEFAKRKRL